MKRHQTAKRRNLSPAILPEGAALLVVQGVNLRLAGDLKRAEELLRRSTSMAPLAAVGWSELGEVMLASARPKEAVTYLRRAAELTKPTPQMLVSLTRAYADTQEYKRARESLAHALEVSPSLEEQAHLMRADIANRENDWKAAYVEAGRYLEIHPQNLHALKLHSIACAKLALLPEAVESARRHLALAPDLALHHWFLSGLNYLAESTPEMVFEESRRWNDLYAAPLFSERRPHTNSRDPERLLKVGYVSADLYGHAVMKMVAPVFEHHDHAAFELFVYSLGSKNRDSLTEQLEKRTANFVTLPPSRHAIVERIRADGIDILVDLTGHTMQLSDAYLTFAAKPAPIQVSWLGSPATTGLSTMDYYLGGPDFPYRGTEHLYSERVYRLPRVSCGYRVPAQLPVADRPCLRNGYITFGSFNNPVKITHEVVKLWCAILHLLPDSHLLFKYQGLEKAEVNERIRRWLAEYGIAPERVEFEGVSERVQYMHSWGRVDIALDPFPYAGGTTTLDALWSGVPVVSLNGRAAAQASGASILKAVGLPVAETQDEYLAMALFLARNTPCEPDIRNKVRQAIASSAFMDAPGLVRALETAYRDMWRTWCQTPS